MKCDQRVKVVFFHAGSALNTLWAASQRGYLTNSRADDENNGKVAFLANSESMGMINLDPRHSRETDRVTVTNYCVTLMMKCNTWHVDYLYDTMVIAIALDVCWDVVMDMKSKKWAERAGLFDDLVGAHTCEGEYATPISWVHTQSTLHMPMVPLSCIAFDG